MDIKKLKLIEVNWQTQNFIPDETKSDPVNHPSHYTSDPSGIECIEVTRYLNFNVGNAYKYLFRAGKKSDAEIQDIQKAIWYLNDEITTGGRFLKMLPLEALTKMVTIADSRTGLIAKAYHHIWLASNTNNIVDYKLELTNTIVMLADYVMVLKAVNDIPAPKAEQHEVDRHAEKQGVSYADAFRYFERRGYDMSGIDEKYRDIP